MQECLGVNITNNVIRYAKVKKDNNNFNVESYGIKFYNDIDATLGQIISETNSSNIPISCNLTNEKYYYFDVYRLANNSYLDKAVKTEFESFCTDNHFNSSVYDGRYICAPNLENSDLSKIIYVYDTQTDVSEKQQFFEKSKLSTLVPLPITLANLVKAEKNKNYMIINIEDQTTITTIINQAIYSVDTIEEGLKEAMEKINEKENSPSKTYEVCKNTTIYTMETEYSSAGNTEYLQYIVPELYKIVEKLQSYMELYKKIDCIYITGLGALVNNVDLYFKEYFKDSAVEVLKPYFLEQQMNAGINVKDYIEVNSAIALAMQGLGEGLRSVNFLKKDWKADWKAFLTQDVGSMGKNKTKSSSSGKKLNFSFSMSDFKGKFDKIEIILTRNIATVLMIIILYVIASHVLVGQINKKIAEANDVGTYISGELKKLNNDDSKITGKTIDYQRYTTNLQDISSSIQSARGRKNQITTLLNKIVYNIPQLVTLVSIDNTEITEGNDIKQHITLQVKSEKYEQIAYFKAKLKNANILEDIVSSEGQKTGGNVVVTIEGNLRTY